ncbi:MAG: hypothetical protein Ct9H300mP17_11360 [Candidatus Nitrosopelagicus sp.]|nr:MAG: hypothetical protein Ct9H300mP17_11360 [Candidatus Nitrosopelagicus sp.]
MTFELVFKDYGYDCEFAKGKMGIVMREFGNM